jgi:allophanate hydrolase subunit 2
MSKRAVIRVIDPGMLTTVQDHGRTGWAGIGVGRGGAADTLSLRIGNRLVGNDERCDPGDDVDRRYV